MKKGVKLTYFNHEIDDLEIDFICELHPESDGIGSYEYWGSTYYDPGNTYMVLDHMKWNEPLYTPTQNETIKKYLDDNWEMLEEKISQKVYSEEDDYYWD